MPVKHLPGCQIGLRRSMYLLQSGQQGGARKCVIGLNADQRYHQLAGALSPLSSAPGTLTSIRNLSLAKPTEEAASDCSSHSKTVIDLVEHSAFGLALRTFSCFVDNIALWVR